MASRERAEDMDEREVRDKVMAAVNRLLQLDKYLLIKNVNERSISHRLATYLQEEFTG